MRWVGDGVFGGGGMVDSGGAGGGFLLESGGAGDWEIVFIFQDVTGGEGFFGFLHFLFALADLVLHDGVASQLSGCPWMRGCRGRNRWEARIGLLDDWTGVVPGRCR